MMNDTLPLQILYVGDGSVSRRLLQIGKLINAVDKAKIDKSVCSAFSCQSMERLISSRSSVQPYFPLR